MLFMNNNYIKIAEKAIYEYLKTGEKLKAETNDELKEIKKGVFVSLKKMGRLRGCIGTIHGRYSVEDEIINNAIAAATEDPRFYPVSIEELDDIEISVDILEPEETVSSISELDPKIYGVIVEQGYKRGLLLPNLVGVDSAEDQIKIAKEKAGIKDGEYKIKKFKVTRYERG